MHPRGLVRIAALWCTRCRGSLPAASGPKRRRRAGAVALRLAGKKTAALSAAEIARIDALVADWRNEVIKPLRAVRRRLKSGPHPAPTKETETLRNSVKAVELSSERIELVVLEAEGQALMAADGSTGDAAGNLRNVVRFFRGAEPDERTATALAVIGNALAAL
jgi:uncharacterized protein (TIGR02444 family)